jgi:site-specific DNA-methyltransferase (adenine-specific)
VPVLDMTVEWTDAKLIKRYDLTEQEVTFIASKIRPYDNTGSGDE